MTVRDPSVDAIIRNPAAADVPWQRPAGSAEPVSLPVRPYGDGDVATYMSLRDYFAAAALQGMLANNPLHVNATVAYMKADEMLRVRNETR